MGSISFINKKGSGGGETPSTSNIKLFETVEEMQADENAQEGDLAVVYNSIEKELVVGETYTLLLLPKAITFDSAITSTKTIYLADGTPLNIPFVRVTNSSINFYKPQFVTGTVVNTVSYTSSDGITYTRTDDLAEILTVAEIYENEYTEITVQEANYDILKQMFKAIIKYFGGLYIYTTANKYEIAENQFTLTSPNQLLPDVSAYGKNGNIVSDGSVVQPDNTFTDIAAQLYYEIQQAYNAMEIRVLTDDDKTVSRDIYFIPTTVTGEPLLDTSNVTNMSYMLQDCSRLQTIPLLDTSNVTNMSSMFSGCSELLSLPALDTSNVTNMNAMFGRCRKLQTIPLLDTSNVTNMSSMFAGCSELQTIPLLNTSKVTNMENMFSGCSELQTIPQLDTSKVTNMSYMFARCSELQTIPLLNTSKVTNMSYMFNNCTSLTTIPQLDTSKVTTMGTMFNNCDNLTDDSLNIILQMLINATGYTATKTLERIGLSEEQATKCTTLSNWAACEAAGWTTGY